MSEKAHQEVITELVATGLLHPQPKLLGWRFWLMTTPSTIQALGLCCLTAVAFSFTEFGSLSDEFRIVLVLAGAFAVAIGGELGTVPATVEIFLKYHSQNATKLDWVAFIFSGLSSLATAITALSFLGGFEIMQNKLRIGALGALAVLDFYFSLVELAGYISTHDQRLEQWRNDYKTAVKEYYQLPTSVEDPIQYETPTGSFAETPTMVSEIVSNNSTEPVRCYCGVVLDSAKAKGPHLKKHYAEWRKFLTPELAYQAMFKKYAETMYVGDVPFPNLDKFKEVMKKQ